MRLSDLKQKEVINITDGIRYGYVYDIEFEKESGKVINIIVPVANKVMGLFGKEEEYIIPCVCEIITQSR